ncbi:hypothetical protein Lal_00022858 [Lupinus albus]|nr:hypothetical protein Lal_00022858 [Lupinus albus]
MTTNRGIFSIKEMGKLKILWGGNKEMATIPGLNQIQFEGFCRFIDRGLTEELYKFPKIADTDQEIEFQLFVKTYQLVEPLVKEKDALYESLTYSSELYEPSKDVLRMRHVNMFDEEPLLNDILQLIGFSKLSSLRSFNIDPSLITTLVERWRPETHTFHLPHGECTITLEDVSECEWPTNRWAYIWNEICEELLGKVHGDEQDMRGCELKLTWLFGNFETLPPRPTQLQKEQFCRARILYMICGQLLPDKSNNMVHLMYLPLLRDLTRVHRYSWGSACLANLYREMCRATKPNAKAMGGCLTLLQSWAWWGQRNLNYRGIPREDLTGYRSRLDRMDFKWLPYENYVDNLSHESACTTLIYFSIVEWLQTDRVRLQFKLQQDLAQPPQNLDALHKVDKRGNLDTNWATRHAEWIDYWSHRRDQVQQGPQIQYPIHTTIHNVV